MLLQEGNDLIGRGVLGRWLADQVRIRDPKTVELAEKELQMQANTLFSSDDLFSDGTQTGGPHIDGSNNPHSGGDAE